MYYIAKVKFETIDDRTGRARKMYEQYLVEAMDISDAENKLKAKFKMPTLSLNFPPSQM